MGRAAQVERDGGCLGGTQGNAVRPKRTDAERCTRRNPSQHARAASLRQSPRAYDRETAAVSPHLATLAFRQQTNHHSEFLLATIRD